MSTTKGNAGDAPQGIAEDLVDALPGLNIYSRLDCRLHTVDEAMEVQNKNNSDQSSPAYKMTHTKRGIALIINNEKFDANTGMPGRAGSTRDVDSMKEVLADKLGFKVIIRNNMAVNKMKSFFKDISNDDHTNNDCFLCVILTHGDDGGIVYGTDGSIALDDLISCILPNKCPSLAGKPKLFFVQACRGTKLDKGVEVHDAIGGFSASSRSPAQKVPLWADMLIAYSSVPGFYSWRNCKKGSWFIQSLCCMLKQHGTELEIQQIMTKVNFQVAYEFESNSIDFRMNGMKQVPYIASMLTKELYFPPLVTSSK